MIIDNVTINEIISSGTTIAYEIIPNNGYVLKWLDGNDYSYSYGYMVIPVDRVDEYHIEAILEKDVPEPHEPTSEDSEV